jgi:hypothetical protein
MRFLVIGLGAGLLALSLAAPANACGAHAVSAEVTAAELSAMAKKPTEEMAKKKPKEKVEYYASSAGKITSRRVASSNSVSSPISTSHGPDRGHNDDDSDEL